MPEEVNRVFTDQILDLLFTHSPEAREDFARGGPTRARAQVGNTMIDTLMTMRSRIAEAQAAQHHDLDAGSYLVVTLHRPALVNGPLLGDAVAALDEIAADMPIVFPIHPRTPRRWNVRALPSPLRLCASWTRWEMVGFLSLVYDFGKCPHRLRWYAGGDDISGDPVLYLADNTSADHLRAGD